MNEVLVRSTGTLARNLSIPSRNPVSSPNAGDPASPAVLPWAGSWERCGSHPRQLHICRPAIANLRMLSTQVITPHPTVKTSRHRVKKGGSCFLIRKQNL